MGSELIQNQNKSHRLISDQSIEYRKKFPKNTDKTCFTVSVTKLHGLHSQQNRTPL